MRYVLRLIRIILTTVQAYLALGIVVYALAYVGVGVLERIPNYPFGWQGVLRPGEGMYIDPHLEHIILISLIMLAVGFVMNSMQRALEDNQL